MMNHGKGERAAGEARFPVCYQNERRVEGDVALRLTAVAPARHSARLGLRRPGTLLDLPRPGSRARRPAVAPDPGRVAAGRAQGLRRLRPPGLSNSAPRARHGAAPGAGRRGPGDGPARRAQAVGAEQTLAILFSDLRGLAPAATTASPATSRRSTAGWRPAPAKSLHGMPDPCRRRRGWGFSLQAPALHADILPAEGTGFRIHLQAPAAPAYSPDSLKLIAPVSPPPAGRTGATSCPVARQPSQMGDCELADGGAFSCAFRSYLNDPKRLAPAKDLAGTHLRTSSFRQ